jgi:hypothetical protein
MKILSTCLVRQDSKHLLRISGAGRALFNDRPGFPKDGRFSKAHPSWIRGALRTRVNVEKSSGNVFADIGFANPEREQLKAHLTLHIYRIIKSRGLT